MVLGSDFLDIDKLMFIGDFTAKPVESFARAFSKARRSRRDRRSPSAEGEIPVPFQSATEG